MGRTRTRSGARRQRTRKGLRGPLPAAWGRPAPLAASGALSLMLGVGVGMVSGLLSGGGEAAATATAQVPAEPATCAQAQVAWSRAATAQVAMSADQPRTLRSGFARAAEALASTRPPEPVLADWQTVLDYMTTVTEAIEKAEGEDMIPEAVSGALGTLDTAAMTTASDRVTTYLRGDCGASDDASDGASDGASDEPSDES